MPTRSTIGAFDQSRAQRTTFGGTWNASGLVVVVTGCAAATLLTAALAILPARLDKAPASPPTAGVSVATGPFEPLFRPAAGLTFVNLPPRVEAEMHSAIQAVQADPQLKGALTEVAGRLVLDHGSRVAIVLALRIDERYAKAPGFSASFLTAAARVSGPRVGETTIAGRRVVRGGDSERTRMLASYEGGVVILVGGASDPKMLEEAMRALLLNSS